MEPLLQEQRNDRASDLTSSYQCYYLSGLSLTLFAVHSVDDVVQCAVDALQVL